MDSRIAYTALVLCVGLERLAEVATSRRHAAWSAERGGVELGAGHYAIMVALHVGLLVGCLLETWLLQRPFLPWLGWPALVVAVACQGVRWWCVRTLGGHWNIRILVVPGMTPVERGPYRWVHHPNYVAVAAEGVALPLVHTAWITALLFTVADVPLLLHRARLEDVALGRAPRSSVA